MQSIYALYQHSSDAIDKEEKFLLQSIENAQDLYLLVLSIFPELQAKEKEYLEAASKKHFATKEELNPNLKFINNPIFVIIQNNKKFIDKIEEKKINNWELNDDMILYLLDKIKSSEIYNEYMLSNDESFENSINFIKSIFVDIIAPDDRLFDYIEDYKLTWIDDLPVINTLIVKQLEGLKNANDKMFIPGIYKDEDDKDFVKQLFRKTVLNAKAFAKFYENKTPNWDTERIAEIDTILLQMAICELQKFPSIPVKVTLNEYLEIAKEYSTSKSSIFINGILDNLVKEFKEKDLIVKTGRGLL